jgi:Raf kinase inhibitor-like YbhB/YbcL family protein
MKWCRLFCVYAMPLIFCVVAEAAVAEGDKTMNLKLESPDFAHMGEIPKRHTCDGEDSAPALNWSNLPAGTQSLALIVDDPDAPDPAAPKLVWVHWVLYNIPASSTGLAAGAEKLPPGTLQGLNDWKRTGYGGPCPPIGRHRYFFKLYALDTILPDLDGPDKSRLEEAMSGHVIGQAELIGTYRH